MGAGDTAITQSGHAEHFFRCKGWLSGVGRIMGRMDFILYVVILGIILNLIANMIWKHIPTGKGHLDIIISGALIIICISLLIARGETHQTSQPHPPIPPFATMVGQYPVDVLANKYWRDTGINVKHGDWLEFTAEGKWWSGISRTGPQGDGGILGLSRPGSGQCPVPEGNLGELIGKVRGQTPFRVGRVAVRNVTKSGNLLLAMNDNASPGPNNKKGSFYDDNSGSLQVRVTVWRIQ